MEETYLYSVHPRRVITDLSGVSSIRVAKSLFLTKEDVYKCLKKATVYRRFANIGINERVTIENVDRVHRDEYISEEDWKKMLASEASGSNRGSVEIHKSENVFTEEEKKENKDVISDETDNNLINKGAEKENDAQIEQNDIVENSHLDNMEENGDNESRQDKEENESVEDSSIGYTITPEDSEVVSDDDQDEPVSTDSSNNQGNQKYINVVNNHKKHR